MQRALAHEANAVTEFAELMADRIFWSPPRLGDGRPVLVLPGMFGNDLYLATLRSWLDRSGYRAVRSSLMVNAGCPERLTRRIEQNLERTIRESDQPIAIIGHSRGGLLARTIAARMQDGVSSLVLLGSPVGGITSWATAAGYGADALAANRVPEAGNSARRLLDPDCNVPDCGCPFPTDFMRRLSPDTRVTSIYSPADPIVPARAAHAPGAHNIRVEGSHTGLAFNRRVYRELVDALRD